MKFNSGKDPSIQFYYKDWLSDNRLKRASAIAKGIWIDLIAVSCDMPEPGVFRDENGIIFESEILKMLSGNDKEKIRGFSELKDRNIIKQFDDGTFYVKRVYKDMKLRAIRKEAGKKGGNPNLVRNLFNQKDNQNPTPSSSSSFSTSISNTNANALVATDDFSSVTTKPAKEKINFNFESGQFEGISNDKKTQWAVAFPAVDIDLELKRAALWVMDNPSKRKSNWGRFLTNWFKRTQERGGNRTYGNYNRATSADRGQCPPAGSSAPTAPGKAYQRNYADQKSSVGETVHV